MQFRGRISVVPGGHCSPGWICVPRAPPGPRLDGCCDEAVPLTIETAAAAMYTNLRGMNALTGGDSSICDAGPQVGTPRAPTHCHFDVIPVMPPSGDVESLAETGAVRASGIRSEAWDRQVPVARVELECAGIGVPGLQPHLGVAELACDQLEVGENRMANTVRAGTSVHALQLTD